MINETFLRFITIKNNQIDLEELMHALKQERATKYVLDNDGRRRKQHAQVKNGSEGVSNSPDNDRDGNDKILPEASVHESGSPSEPEAIGTDGRGEGGGNGGGGLSQAEEQTSKVVASTVVQGQQQQQDSKEEKPVFSPAEAESLTSYLVESQQAFSLINVADIQHGEVDKRVEQLSCTLPCGSLGAEGIKPVDGRLIRFICGRFRVLAADRWGRDTRRAVDIVWRYVRNIPTFLFHTW